MRLHNTSHPHTREDYFAGKEKSPGGTDALGERCLGEYSSSDPWRKAKSFGQTFRLDFSFREHQLSRNFAKEQMLHNNVEGQGKNGPTKKMTREIDRTWRIKQSRMIALSMLVLFAWQLNYDSTHCAET